MAEAWDNVAQCWRETVSRQTAELRGLTRFFTGRPCKHGHITERTTAEGKCVECRRAYLRRYFQDPERRERKRQASNNYLARRWRTDRAFRQRKAENKRRRNTVDGRNA